MPKRAERDKRGNFDVQLTTAKGISGVVSNQSAGINLSCGDLHSSFKFGWH